MQKTDHTAETPGMVAQGSLAQKWREAWDALPLARQLRVAVLGTVTLAVLAALVVVAVVHVTASYFVSRSHVQDVMAKVLAHDDSLGNGDIFAGVQARPGVIAATLEQPSGEVVWTFDRNAPDVAGIVRFGAARPLTEDSVAWYEQYRLEPELGQALWYVADRAPNVVGEPAELKLLVAAPSPLQVLLAHLRTAPFVLAIAAVLAFLAGRRLSRQVAEPLEQLAEATRVEGRHGSKALPVARSGNELTRLANNFGALNDRLAENEREMRNVRLAARQQILQQTREVELRLQRSEALVQSKDQFLANMSHEIRTPMNGVMGMAELLAGTTLDKRQRRFVDSMREAAGTMMQIINDILDDSKLEAGKMDLVCEPLEVRDLVEQAAQLYAGRAETKKLELICQVEPGVPAVVIGDALRLRQVLGNLLSNAVKYTDRGDIQLRVGIDDLAHGSQCRLHFGVSDTGPGIAASHHATVFEAFTQLDNASRVGGTGLGLAIATGLVRLMGGERIDLRSQVGHGSTFSFELPFEIVEQAPRADGTEFSGLRTLIVDDVATSYLSLQEVLTSWGVEVTVSKNGRNLDDLVSSAARLGRPFDVVLLDHTLPDATTEDLLRAIRLDSTAPDTYVALLSAFDFEPRQVGDRAVRPDVCIPKPVRQRQLRDVLCTARAARDGTTGTFDVPVLPKVAPAPGLGLHVLVADDNSINRDVASAMLELLACRTVVVGNGQEAVEAARATRFDVILMDCQMPVMDGYAATAAIRREQGTREAVPPHIVALTANALTRDRERCLAAGMDSFLAKPFTQAQLVRLLQPIAEARGTLLPAQAVDADVPAAAEPAATNPAVSSGARSAAPAAPEDLSSTATLTLLDTQILRAPAAPAAKVLDGEQVQSIRGLGQPQLFERLCAMLFETGPQSVHTIRAALDAGDLAAAAAATHSLKSSVSNLGGRRLAEQLDALEETIRERNEVRAARGIASGLEQSYAQFEQALRDETRRSTGT